MTVEGPATGTSPCRTLVLYDGVCGLCNRLVRFLIRHDRRDRFRFAALQSDFGRKQLRRYGLSADDLDTVVVFADFGGASERALTRSNAGIWAIQQLGGVWKLVGLAKGIPLATREAMYKYIASRRYRTFGKYDECPLPGPEDRKRFLDQG